MDKHITEVLPARWNPFIRCGSTGVLKRRANSYIRTTIGIILSCIKLPRGQKTIWGRLEKLHEERVGKTQENEDIEIYFFDSLINDDSCGNYSRINVAVIVAVLVVAVAVVVVVVLVGVVSGSDRWTGASWWTHHPTPNNSVGSFVPKRRHQFYPM